MKKSMLGKSLIVLVVGLMAATGASAQEYTITVKNITHGIYFTPLLITAHDGATHLFQVGETATPEQQRTAFLLGLGFSLLMCLAVFVLAAPIGAFYGDPRVVRILRVLGLTFPISSLCIVPRSMLRRSLKLRGEALSDTVSMLTGAGAAISLAWLGFGVWALVAGELVTSTTVAVGLWVASPWRPGLRVRARGRRAVPGRPWA